MKYTMRVAALFFFVVQVVATATAAALSDRDAAAIRVTMDRYVARWLAGDPAEVMRLLTPDSVLVPNEKAPLVGAEAIRRYWWPPDSPPFKLTRFEVTHDGVGGSSEAAFVRGTQVIEWTTGGERWRTRGNYVTFLRKTPHGWKIVLQMAGNSANERIQ